MPRGKRSQALRPDQIKRLERFRVARRLSIVQLNAAMGGRQNFTWEVLDRALKGKPVAEINHRIIVDWMERHVPEEKAPRDYKTAAAGDRADESALPAGESGIPEQPASGRRESGDSAEPVDGATNRRGSD